jgi:hypothetical protein
MMITAETLRRLAATGPSASGQTPLISGQCSRSRAVDGFNITPHLLPASLADIVDKVVPELQDRGLYRAKYESTTRREHLALPPLPVAAAAAARQAS